MVKLKQIFAIACMVGLGCINPASAGPNQDEMSMNGYTKKQFGDFTKTWNLVTVRYRKDTGEMRMTYANDLAWKTLRANRIDYPAGSVFAKVGVMTKEDPAFPSSAVPAGARRVQFMVRDEKAHAYTQGWGYALFDMDGRRFPGDVKQASLACAACHSLVPQRGYVFSQPLSIAIAPTKDEPGWFSHLRFEDPKPNEVPAAVTKWLPPKVEGLHLLRGKLTKAVFPGTLDEVRPLLAKQTFSTGRPTLLLEDGGSRFSLVFPLNKPGKCKDTEMSLKGVHTLANGKFFEVEFCQQAED